ncbi:sulfotransferase [Synechococcus sp. CCY9201]|uniref:sulfotransferase family protein n=1 Tax=Synechococcus sp. CCY9201 TaxID=174697 RepID=UPI002B1F12A2|nr:sulfotransferase [Synechococcus sp. CCY9201]MEA5472773.1 sulfotransferase [Synechococcus sp. CCY9201]
MGETSRLRLPDFVGLGAQKGGTTSLHRLLADHPQVWLPASKELHYFTLNHARGPIWYGQHYAAARNDQRCGDITPYYLFHPAAPQRLHDLIPGARLVVLLRDPVERALSGLFHSIRLGLESLPPEQALAAESGRLAGADEQLRAGLSQHHSHQVHSYLSRSCYGPQLERYEVLFAPEQLLLIKAEDLFDRPELVWPRLLGFLGLDPSPLPERLPRHNAGGGEAGQVPQELRRQLRRQLEPTYDQMARRYGITWP